MLRTQSDTPTRTRGPAGATPGGLSGGLNPILGAPTSPKPVSRPSGGLSGLPDRRRVLHLVDRAERNALTPTEAALLRGLVLRLLVTSEAVRENRYRARGRLARVRTALARALADRDAAQRQAEAATARLERVLVEAGGVSPLMVECPSCGVPAGQRCRAAQGSRKRLYVEHAPRRRAVGQAMFADALAEAVAA